MGVIKFRLRDKNNKILGYEKWNEDLGIWQYSFKDCKYWFQGFKYLNQVKYKDSYTGLHDKNNKEIYNGDIVKFAIDCIKEVSEVFFDEGGFSVNAKNNDPNYKPYLGEIRNAEIIDVSENPKLVKEVK